MISFHFSVVFTVSSHDLAEFTKNFYNIYSGDTMLQFANRAFVADCFRENTLLFDFEINEKIKYLRHIGATIVRVEPDPMVTLLDIYVRVGIRKPLLKKELVTRFGNDFPSPRMRVISKEPLWDWCEVASWFYKQNKVTLHQLNQAIALKNANMKIMFNQNN